MTAARPEVGDYLRVRFPGAEISPITGDASGRSFSRLRTIDGSSHVVMDYGRPFSGDTDDQKLTRLFEAAGLPVAGVEDAVPDLGILILEDLGGVSLSRTLRETAPGPAPPPALEDAVELAAEVASNGTPVLAESERAFGPALDSERFRFEMEFFLEHFAEGFAEQAVDPGLRVALSGLADRAAETPRRVLCHRDFHSRNLMVTDDGSLAMVDIQDARWGPDSYDLASLLRDAYVDIPEHWIDPLIQRYLGALPDSLARETFRDRFDVVSAQRMIKALGTFGNQIVALGREQYREAIPRTVDRLVALLPQLPAARPLARSIERVLAEGLRRAR